MDESKLSNFSWSGSKFYHGHPANRFAVTRSGPDFSRTKDVEAELPLEDSVKYYVVMLTWYAQPAV